MKQHTRVFISCTWLLLPAMAALVGCDDADPPPCGVGCLTVADAGTGRRDARGPEDPSPDAGAPLDGAVAEAPAPIPPFDISFLDTQASPCDDFYQFACGGWIQKNPLRPGELSKSTYSSWSQGVWNTVIASIDEAVAQRTASTNAEVVTIGNFYQSCMDAETQPASRTILKAVVGLVDSLGRPEDLATVTAELRKRGVHGLFRMYVGVDPGQSSRYILTIDQGARQLPSRLHYFDTTPAAVSARMAYLGHIQKMAQLLGVTVDPQAVLRVETALAQGELTPTQKSDPLAIYHKMPLASAMALAPSFPWQAHFTALGYPAVTEVNVISPDALKAVQTVLSSASIDDLKHYLRWQIIDDKADLLDKPALEEEFAFHGKVLSGATSQSTRRSTCLTRTRSAFPYHLSKRYLQQHFPNGAKYQATLLVKSVRDAYRRKLAGSMWLDAATRQEALAKLDAMAEKIGHPEPMPVIRTVPPMRMPIEDDLEGNLSSQQGIIRALGPEAKPNRAAWLSAAAPITINAFYVRERNDINLPAAILYLPHFDIRRPAVANYGAIGRTIGHEITHAFDNNGRLYDGEGSLRQWWTPMVDAEFKMRSSCVGDRFGKYEALPGQFVDPVLTMGENLADLEGVRLAFEAFVHDKPMTEPYMGYTDRQQFFLANAQARCSVQAPQWTSDLLKNDPHAPDRARVNLVLAEIPEFGDAFNCPAGSRMRSANACRIW